ncbi:hypothetical protein Tco_0899894 [Tanacetum coccineum]
MTSSSKTSSPNFKRKTARISVKYPTYVNLISLSEEHPNERTPSPPSKNKSLSPPQAPSKSIFSKSTHYTSSSSPSESLTPTHVAPPPKLHFVIPLKLKPQELPLLASSQNDPYVSTMDNWPSGPSKSSPPPRITQPPPVSTHMDTSEKLMPNNGQAVSQVEYLRVIGCLMYAMTCTRPDIAFAVGKLSRYTSNPGYTDASWISNSEENLSTSSWVFLLGGGAISWASKKQTCITGLIIESEFVAFTAAGKEAECVATLAKAYSQMYNGKSRHLGVRHSIFHELVTNGVISIEFVRSQQNLVDHLTKGLTRDLVIKYAEGMGLKYN